VEGGGGSRVTERLVGRVEPSRGGVRYVIKTETKRSWRHTGITPDNQDMQGGVEENTATPKNR